MPPTVARAGPRRARLGIEGLPGGIAHDLDIAHRRREDRHQHRPTLDLEVRRMTTLRHARLILLLILAVGTAVCAAACNPSEDGGTNPG